MSAATRLALVVEPHPNTKCVCGCRSVWHHFSRDPRLSSWNPCAGCINRGVSPVCVKFRHANKRRHLKIASAA